ncbi:MAG: peptidase T [Symbiobacteriaceae bacterium]|nr:peptidase T [Symbiobacteriaceae bacterium]
MSLSREELLNEGLLAKFIRYVKVDSQSVPNTGKTPSSEEQWEMARLLFEELQTLGVEDALLDEFGFVTGTLKATPGCENSPAIGYFAHYDTVPGLPAQGVVPIIHHDYQGQIITLPSGAVLDPNQITTLQQVIGHDLVSSDGNTLLGADDKSGVAAIMEALCSFIKNPSLPHGPFKVAFTPDEEVGTGIGNFNIQRFGAVAAYTFDGGGVGSMEDETFNAQNFTMTITGRSTHTGSARNLMINAIHLAGVFCAMIPATMRPETTDGRWGYIHPNNIRGNLEEVKLDILVRDFDASLFTAKKELLASFAKQLETAYPGAKVTLQSNSGYRNMKEILDGKPEIVEIAQMAMRNLGIEPEMSIVRGGTDGSQLTYMGLPTPNIFCGGGHAHARTEWCSVQWMQQCSEVIIKIAELWSQR